ncbi:hypothetical protein LOTGIDRAFT_232252 [Lottia gigantea]|uniref:Uncharacterized protein n=1 Tax=Lottia gigantea TaxID=225164 RepID=V3ZTK6_LOTGI|nr:hypothetical protein LOTGIDRAFT_232252 [Lottia gigantea]ESO94798.1 hypothetical protein LOTGIDRAFT_232252 [Lottia gigantea]
MSNFNDQFSSSEIRKIKDLIYSYKDVFSLSDMDKGGKIETQWLNPEEPYVDTRVVSMEDFLQATTGSRAIVKNAATVNTCAPSITITQTELNQDYCFFENSMINITVAYGFGIN